MGLYNNVQAGGQAHTNGPNNYYQQQQQQQQPQRLYGREPSLPQQAQSGQPVPSYLTNGSAAKTHYPSPSPSPHEIRLPSMSPFNNLAYANQLHQSQRSRHTPPVAASNAPSLPPISQLKPPVPAPVSAPGMAPAPAQSPLPAPTPPPSIANYQHRQVNGGASTGGRYSNSFYYQNQSLLIQQYELQQQQQQLQQQLQIQQREELKQQQAFYSSLTNSRQQTQSHHAQQPQSTHRPQSRDYPNANPPSQSPSRSSAPSGPAIAPTRTSTSRTTPTNKTGGTSGANSKRESPLDLSVKTVRQSADSTAENSNTDSGTTYYYFQQEGVRAHQQNSSASNQQSNPYAAMQPATTPKVDFSPNFSQHAHILQSHQNQPQSRPQSQQSVNYRQQHQPPSQQQPHAYQQQLPPHSRAAPSSHQPSSRGSSSQHHPAANNVEKQRWKKNMPTSFPLPSTSVLKPGSSSGMPPYNPTNLSGSNNMPGTSGNVGLLSGHYHVNHLGQTIPKPSYPQEPTRYQQNYLKRPPSEDQSKASAPVAPKQPRISADDRSWKASIDREIEERFNTYLSSKGLANGEVSKASSESSTGATVTQTSVPYPAPPIKNLNHSQHVQPQQQTASLQHGYPSSADKNSHSSGSGGGAADKRVLSILRNSLETKEARLQQQLAKSPLQYTELTTRPPSSIHQMYSQSHHRQPLPAFQSLGPPPPQRDSFPTHPRLSIPKAIDSVKELNRTAPPYLGSNVYPPHFPTEYRPHLHPGMLQHHSSHRVPTIETSNRQSEVVDITKEETSDLVNLSPRAMPSQPSLLNFNNQARLPGAVQNGANPPSSKGDFDGLAAFLAARIRTKAELKQATPDSKDGLKGLRLGTTSGRGRGGRGRGRRGGGPGSRGGRGARTKKTLYGDGSDFRTPGWEDEVYKFKKSLRMPPRLINIARPSCWPKPPLSLPDLEAYPDSPMTNDSADTFPGKNNVENGAKKENVEPAKEEDKKSLAKSLGEDHSFLNRLMAKYTARKKKIKKESPAKAEWTTGEDAPELLPTPSLLGAKDPGLLGFRKETINEYREEFLKSGSFTAEADLPPTILETRTRTENKLYQERLTIREVFGTERPASAPPPGTTTDDLRRRQRLRKNKQMEKKKRMMVRAKKEKLRQEGAGKGSAAVPKEANLDGIEIEESEFPLPTLYRLSGDNNSWVLFHELAPLLDNIKSKEALCKVLKQDSSTVVRDMKLHEFYAKAHARNVLRSFRTVLKFVLVKGNSRRNRALALPGRSPLRDAECRCLKDRSSRYTCPEVQSLMRSVSPMSWKPSPTGRWPMPSASSRRSADMLKICSPNLRETREGSPPGPALSRHVWTDYRSKSLSWIAP
ncbi:unnamed protein product [Nesidiocoris tenuis]|uniref:Uncharacterized protein n=1 Tax=Nesidiocoris tenuis TaxID=355587 RepID=A0A6H5H3L5_9HEMI|nr:unnamed protein product [Nesidiocoris tenuis]